jgi:Rrf2 family protein
MFSQTVEYALRAVVHLAMKSPQPQKTAEIAEATQVPPAYLSKVLQGLKEKGVVRLQRGIGGGVALAHQPDQLTILDIVNAVDPIKRITTCPLDLTVKRCQEPFILNRQVGSDLNPKQRFLTPFLACRRMGSKMILVEMKR